MPLRTLPRRLARPIGFLAVAGCFLLPFTTVSCQPADEPDRLTANYSGIALIRGDHATLTMSPSLQAEIAGPETPPPDVDATEFALAQGILHPIDPQPLLVVALVLVLIGVAAAAVPPAWWRALAEGTAAGLALIFLAGGEVIGVRAALARAQDDVHPLNEGADFGVLENMAAAPAYGFWLAAAGLAALTISSAISLIASSRRTSAAEAEPPVAATAPG